MTIKFTESHAQHAIRLVGERGSRRRTKIMRTALLHHLNAGRQLSVDEIIDRMGGSNCPYWLAQTNPDELMSELGVILRDEKLICDPEWKRDRVVVGTAVLRKRVHTTDGVAKTEARREQGKPPGKLCYGYRFVVSSEGETIVLIPEFRPIIRNAFRVAREDGYSAAGAYLTGVIPTPQGNTTWTKDDPYTWLRHSQHAGYNGYKQMPGQKHSPVDFIPASQTDPPVTLAEWIAANETYAQSGKIFFPDGFRNDADRQAWQRRNFIRRYF